MAHKLKVRLRNITIVAFLLTGFIIIILVVLPKNFFMPQKKEVPQSRIIVPEAGRGGEETSDDMFRMLDGEGILSVITLDAGEIQIGAIAEDFDNDGGEEQVILYRNMNEANNPLYITFVDYDERQRSYQRLWSTPSAAVNPATASLISMDLIGDHHNCVLVTGMNQKDEQTLTAYRIIPAAERKANAPLYKIIVRITIDGTIGVQEVERSQAYQMGFAPGASWMIISRGRDPYSANRLDQIENTWAYNPVDGVYERISSLSIAGAQIETKRLREILSGGKQNFEQFVDGLWYHINSEGAIDNDRYIYFDTANHEISFYNDDTQQIYRWQSSYPTHYGLFISSQNISVTTLNRKIDVELESLDSIRVRVSEDVRMRIIMNAPWDGSYRKATTLHNAGQSAPVMLPAFDAEYSSVIGRVSFFADGRYSIELNNSRNEGSYIFYKIGGKELLEFIPHKELKLPKQTYRVERSASSNSLSLVRVRLGVNGLYEFHEPRITLN